MNPKISIITPSFNQGQFIEETILSILNQDYSNIEYIIIDGGSNDNTVDIIKKYSERITYWVSEKDSGQSEAINKGFMKATGDIVCWINSDDILMPGAVKKVMQYFSEHPDIKFINGYVLLIDKNSNILFNYFILKQKNWYAKHGIFYVSQQAMFWKRSLFNSIGYLKEDFHAMMDREFLIRVLKNKIKVGQIKKTLSGFRRHEASKTYINSEIWDKDSTEIIKIYGNGYGRKPLFLYKTVYGMEKLIKLLYLKQLIFALKWKGKSVKCLNSKNCSYLR